MKPTRAPFVTRLLIASLLCLCAGTASSQTSSVTNSVTNGATAGNGSLQPRITEQPTTDEALRADNIRLTRELEELKALSGKAVDIDKNNKALIRKNELLQTEVDKLSAENDRLGSQAAREEWIRTLIAIGLGILLTLALPRLIPHKKRYSDW